VAIKREYESLYLLGYALAVSGKKEESIGYLVEAAALDPTDERAFYSLGYVYRDTGRPEEAKQAWRKVLELMPNFPEVQRNLQSLSRRAP